jgi:hypothetical protein
MPQVTINSHRVAAAANTTVAAAILAAGVTAFRRSITGEPRGPLCGMGIRYECRVTVDGEPHARSCPIICREGMVIETA